MYNYVYTVGLSQNCYSEPNCQGDLVQPGVVVTARDCCVGTDEGMSFSRDNGTTCTLFQCIGKKSSVEVIRFLTIMAT